MRLVLVFIHVDWYFQKHTQSKVVGYQYSHRPHPPICIQRPSTKYTICGLHCKDIASEALLAMSGYFSVDFGRHLVFRD